MCGKGFEKHDGTGYLQHSCRMLILIWQKVLQYLHCDWGRRGNTFKNTENPLTSLALYYVRSQRAAFQIGFSTTWLAEPPLPVAKRSKMRMVWIGIGLPYFSCFFQNCNFQIENPLAYSYAKLTMFLIRNRTVVASKMLPSFSVPSLNCTFHKLKYS